MAVSESWSELLKLAADNEELLSKTENVETVEKFFCVAHYNNPRDVVGQSLEILAKARMTWYGQAAR